MIHPIADQLDETGNKRRAYYSCIYEGGNLPTLPWGEAKFDCVVIAADSEASRSLASSFSETIVNQAVDYVVTTGKHAEYLHDVIDETSVYVGVMNPENKRFLTTTWHSEARSLDEMCEVAADYLGSAEHVLCVVIGTEEDREAFASRLRDRLVGNE